MTPDLHWRCCAFDQLTVHELQRIHAARQQVFVLEQQCVYVDADEADPSSHHLAAWSADGRLLAYARLVRPGVKYAEPSIGRVLTTAAARGDGLGRELVRRALAQAELLWPGAGLRISAQSRLEAFYAGFGFSVVGEPYLEDGIPHTAMALARS